MRKDRRELILHGNIYKAIAIISIPIILNNFIQQLYSLADAFWLGKLGTAEFAATSFTWPVIFLFNSIGIGLSIAAISLISQLIGMGDIKLAQKYNDTIINISLLFSLVFMVVGFFTAESIVTLMGQQAIYINFLLSIWNIRILGSPLYFYISSMQQSSRHRVKIQFLQ